MTPFLGAYLQYLATLSAAKPSKNASSPSVIMRVCGERSQAHATGGRKPQSRPNLRHLRGQIGSPQGSRALQPHSLRASSPSRKSPPSCRRCQSIAIGVASLISTLNRIILFENRNRLKLADFGSTVCFIESVKSMWEIIGTHYYVSQEVIIGRHYTEKVNIRTVGDILFSSGHISSFGATMEKRKSTAIVLCVIYKLKKIWGKSWGKRKLCGKV